MKNWMASLNARKLDGQRFGKEYEQICQEIHQRDSWSAEQFQKYQLEMLQLLIPHAVRNVPYYREKFKNLGINPKAVTELHHLQQLPILEKQTIREHPEDFVDENLNKKKLIVGNTSGTTGTPLVLYRDIKLASTATAFFDMRCREVANMCRRRNSSVSIGGHLVTAPDREKPPFWVYNKRWKQLYMSSYHLSPRYLPHYVDELRKFKADYVEGYPSSVYAIAQHIVENNLEPIAFKACFTTAENLFDSHRQAIQSAFKCRTYNQYGCGEIAIFATECEHGSMHISSDYGIVEIVDEDDNPLPIGQTGCVLCTSLVNFVQPFIRYRLGDMAALGSKPCKCGSPLPVLHHVEGRTDDVLITHDGRRIGRLDPVLKGVTGILETQIIQNDHDKFKIKIVPGSKYSQKDAKIIIENLAQRVGQADITVEIVKQIERTSAGKFRAVINNMNNPV